MHAQRLAADRASASELRFADLKKMPTYSPYEGIDAVDPRRDPWRVITSAQPVSVDFDRDGKVDQVSLYTNTQQYAVIVRFTSTCLLYTSPSPRDRG